MLYYSPTSNFIKVNSPETNLTCDKSVYDEMQQVPASKAVPIPRQFYSLMPQAQAEYEKNEDSVKAVSNMEVPATVSVKEPNAAQAPVPVTVPTKTLTPPQNVPQTGSLPAAAVMDDDMNKASVSNDTLSSNESTEEEADNFPETFQTYTPYNQTKARFESLFGKTPERGHYIGGRRTLSVGDAIDRSEDRFNEFEHNNPRYMEK